MMQPVVSVIVPVYKVEDCLSRCLDSLCRQSLKNIEILLIDDASPDRSSKICEHYAARDARFKVLYHTENKGLSEARNTGIAKATSNYLMFVDSDDWVHEDFCKDAYECAVNYGVDLVMFRHARIAMPIFFPCNTRIEHTMQSGYKTRMEAMDILLNITNHNVWNKLYRKELFFNIFFPPGCLYEDVGTTYKTVWRASRIYFLDKTLYYHCYHAGSITTIKTEKSFHDWFEMHMQRYHDLASWGYPLEKLNELYEKIKNGQIDSWQSVHEYYNCVHEKYLDYSARYAIHLLEYLYSCKVKSYLKGITIRQTPMQRCQGRNIIYARWLIMPEAKEKKFRICPRKKQVSF